MRRPLAQSSVEFMLMLGVLLVIALVIVSLLSIYTPATSDPRIIASQSYWASNAHPLQVRDFSLDFYVYAAQTAGNLTLVIKNPASQDVTLRQILITPGNFSSVFYANGSSAGTVNSLSVLFTPSEEATLIVQHRELGSGAYRPPSIGEFSLSFNYSTAIGPGIQNGSLPLVMATNMH